MDAGSCLSQLGASPFRLGIGIGRRSGVVIESPPLAKKEQQQLARSPSFAETEASATKSTTTNKPRMAHLQTLEAKVSEKGINYIHDQSKQLFGWFFFISEVTLIRNICIKMREGD